MMTNERKCRPCRNEKGGSYRFQRSDCEPRFAYINSGECIEEEREERREPQRKRLESCDPCEKKRKPCEREPEPCKPCEKKPEPCKPCEKKPEPCKPCEKKPEPCKPCEKKPEPCKPCEDKKKCHMHQFVGCTEFYEDECEEHNHRFCGETSEAIWVECGDHYHEICVCTDEACVDGEEHAHEIKTCTSGAIDVGCGKHVHLAFGHTSCEECHKHRFIFATLINENDHECKKEERDCK